MRVPYCCSLITGAKKKKWKRKRWGYYNNAVKRKGKPSVSFHLAIGFRLKVLQQRYLILSFLFFCPIFLLHERHPFRTKYIYLLCSHSLPKSIIAVQMKTININFPSGGDGCGWVGLSAPGGFWGPSGNVHLGDTPRRGTFCGTNHSSALCCSVLCAPYFAKRFRK